MISSHENKQRTQTKLTISLPIKSPSFINSKKAKTQIYFFFFFKHHSKCTAICSGTYERGDWKLQICCEYLWKRFGEGDYGLCLVLGWVLMVWRLFGVFVWFVLLTPCPTPPPHTELNNQPAGCISEYRKILWNNIFA